MNSQLSSAKPTVNCVATIGSFDGVHRGHQCLLRQVRNLAHERGLKAVAVTFDKVPREALELSDSAVKTPRTTKKGSSLTNVHERMTLLRQAGMDEVVLLPFTRKMASLTAREFMQKVLQQQCGVAVLVVGYDHRFGHGRTDGFDDYVRYGQELGIEVIRGEVCIDGDAAVSSTRIRHHIAEGEITKANNLLGYRYILEGKVIDGYKVGRKIGFPTANIQVSEPNKLLPTDGVYAVRVCIENENISDNDDGNDNNSEFKNLGMLNIGHRPTLANGEERSIEVHILDFEGDLYGKSLRLELIERLREERTFGSLDELVTQLHIDMERVRLLAENEL